MKEKFFQTYRLLIISLLYIIGFIFLLIGLQQMQKECMATQTIATQNITMQNLCTPTVSAPSDSISSDKFQSEIADKVLRLHVIANSDSKEDQALKYKVRDEILSILQESMKQADSVKKAKELVASKTYEIQKKANHIIEEEGYNYTVSISIGTRNFPEKTYGDLTFPSGDYEALCIQIGKASGQNWWCVLFPSLCFIDETTATVPDDSKEKLKENLDAAAYDSLYVENTPTPSPAAKESETKEVEIHSVLFDWISTHF